VGSSAFKAVETGDPRLAGSIPVHLRHPSHARCLARCNVPDMKKLILVLALLGLGAFAFKKVKAN
jgi:hypothetical protein